MSDNTPYRPPTAHSSDPPKGRALAPGDTLMSLAALALGALSTGRTRIAGLPETDDVLATAKALDALGAPVRKAGDVWQVLGRGAGGLSQPLDPLDLGASLASARLLMGVIAGQAITVTISGEEAVLRQAMQDVLQPLAQMGLEVIGDSRDMFPLSIRGSRTLVPMTHELPAAPAEIKAAVLLAGLAAPGETTVVTEATDGELERLMRLFGATLRTEKRGSKIAVTVTGETELRGVDVTVPLDPSSAA